MQPSYIVTLDPGHMSAAADGEVCDALELVALVLAWLIDAEPADMLDETADEELVDPLIIRTATSDPELTRVPPGDLR